MRFNFAVLVLVVVYFHLNVFHVLLGRWVFWKTENIYLLQMRMIIDPWENSSSTRPECESKCSVLHCGKYLVLAANIGGHPIVDYRFLNGYSLVQLSCTIAPKDDHIACRLRPYALFDKTNKIFRNFTWTLYHFAMRDWFRIRTEVSWQPYPDSKCAK